MDFRFGGKAYERLESFCESPYGENEKLLMSILEKNKHTKYGQKYHFENIHSVSDFQKTVPLSVYDNYAAAISEMTNNGVCNLICADDIEHYNKSSGTMGIPKRIPISKSGLETYYVFGEELYLDLAQKHYGAEFSKGPFIRLIESTAEEDRLPAGASYSAISNKLTRMKMARGNIEFTSPKEALFPAHGTDTKYLHVRFALMNKHATVLRATFFGFLLEFMRYIEKNWRFLCDEIEKGSISSDIKLPAEVRESLYEKIKPMPDRAKELREIFSEGFSPGIMKKIWPDLFLIAGIGSGGFKSYLNTMKQRYFGDDIDTMTIGYAASEGYFGAPYALNTQDCVFVTESAFYEFLPLEAGDDYSKIVTIKDVEVGKDYELIITNLSGFYRYRIKDVVRITGMYKNAPTFEFLYRQDLTVSLMGEKTTEPMFSNAAKKTAEELGFDLIDYTVYEDLNYEPVRYEIFIEAANIPESINPRIIRLTLEKYLSIENPSYGEKVSRNILSNLRLDFVEPETYALYHDMMIYSGTATNQVKPVHKVANEKQRRFFFYMTIYSSEKMK